MVAQGSKPLLSGTLSGNELGGDSGGEKLTRVVSSLSLSTPARHCPTAYVEKGSAHERGPGIFSSTDGKRQNEVSERCIQAMKIPTLGM